MKSKKFVIISIVILSFLLLMQTYTLLKNSFANRIINPNYHVNWNNYYNMVYGYSLEASKNYINNLKDSHIFVLLGNSITNYTKGLDIERGFTNVTMYPAKVVEVLHLTDINENFIEYLLEQKTNYIIIFGKNETYYHQTTTNDVNLYSIDENNELNLVKAFDNDLYSLSKLFKENNQEKIFNEFLSLVKQMSENYYFPETISAIRTYSDQLYKNKEYDKALEYYQFILKFNTLNKEVIYNIGDIYYELADYKKAVEYFSYCKNIDPNYLDIDQKLKEVGEFK